MVLSFFVPKIFTSIAFDSGGVASGPMTATFLLPLQLPGRPPHNAPRPGGRQQQHGLLRGLQAQVIQHLRGGGALSQGGLLTIQLLGLAYQWKLKAQLAQAAEDEEIIDLGY